MAEFLHPQSAECTKSELDLFQLPPTQTCIDQGYWHEVFPIASLSDASNIEFVVSPTDRDYLDFANTYLHLKVRVVTHNGKYLSPAQSDNIVPVNNLFHSLFSKVVVNVGGTDVSLSYNTYAYRAYLENLLSFGGGAKNTQLASVMWYKDTAGHMEVIQGDDNKGASTRRNFIRDSRLVDMMGRLHTELCHQSKPILNKTEVKFKLVRSSDAFCLMEHVPTGKSAVQPKICIEQAVLFVRKIQPSEAVIEGHIRALERGTAKYPIRPAVVKPITIAHGNVSVNVDNLFMGNLPRMLILGMVSNAAFSGKYHLNPFHFVHNHLNRLTLHIKDKQIPGRALEPDFERMNYMRSYLSLFTGSGKANQDEGNDITYEEYANGYTLFGFDLTPDLCDGEHFNPLNKGSVRVEMHFEEAPAETLTLLAFAEFESVIEINRARKCIVTGSIGM